MKKKEQQLPNANLIHHYDEYTLVSNSQVIFHDAERFVFDFQSISPQFGPDCVSTPIISHKSVSLAPFRAKSLRSILDSQIKKYEERFGEIKVPEALEKDNALAEAHAEKMEADDSSMDYVG